MPDRSGSGRQNRHTGERGAKVSHRGNDCPAVDVNWQIGGEFRDKIKLEGYPIFVESVQLSEFATDN